MQRKTKVLFLSRGNSTRSQMAEGFLRAFAGEQFIVQSAGIEPGSMDPLAIEVMNELGMDISGQESIEIAQALKEHYGYVITVCDLTKERSPIFPFAFNLLHWSVMDPTTKQGSQADKKVAFRRVRDEIKINVQCFLGETMEKKQEPGVLAYA